MFRSFPKIIYKIDDFDYLKVSDISFYSKLKDFVISFGYTSGRPYIIQNGDPPATVSYKIYNTTRFDYSIMILNNKRNLFDEWPRSEQSFLEYIEAKYGTIGNAQNTQAFFYRGDGKRVSRETWLSLVDSAKYFETFYEYETRLNDEKSRIKLVDYNIMLSFDVELRQLTAKLMAEELNKAQQ